MRSAGPAANSGDVPFDVNDPNTVNWQPHQNAAQAAVGGQSVIFLYRPILNPEKSKQEGRPRYDRVPFIRIAAPGDRDNVIVRQVWLDETESNIMADNVRFKAKWDLFLKGQEVPEDGTPLEHWPAITSEQRAELTHFNIRTVEQLASLSDINAGKFLGIRALKKLAQDFLDAAKDGAVITRLHGKVDEQEARIKEYEKNQHEMAETIRQLREMVEVQQRIQLETSKAPVDPERIVPPTGDGERIEDPTPPSRPSFLRPGSKKGQ